MENILLSGLLCLELPLGEKHHLEILAGGISQLLLQELLPSETFIENETNKLIENLKHGLIL